MNPPLLVLLLATCAPGVFAASSVDLAVVGTITPSACTPHLSAGGVVEYGKIPARDLEAETFTRLPASTLQLSVGCEASTMFAMRLTDNRAGSSADVPGSFGLGLINGSEKLGAFHVIMHTPLADNAPITQLQSMNEGQSWYVVEQTVAWPALRLAAFGTASSGVWAPIPIKDLRVAMVVTAVIAPSKHLTLNTEVPLDGAATLDVVYL